MLIWQEWVTNKKLNKSKKKRRGNEYDNKKTECIYDELIDYDEDIYKEELYGILQDTERNTITHQEKDKEYYEDAEEENYTQDMKMDHPEEEIILYYCEDKDDDVIN